MARRQSQGQFVRIVGRHYRRLSIIVEAEKHTGKEACSPKETHEGMILPSFVLFANSESKQRRKVSSWTTSSNPVVTSDNTKGVTGNTRTGSSPEILRSNDANSSGGSASNWSCRYRRS